MSDGLAYPLGTGELGGILAYHLLLVSTLLAAGLIAYDGHLAPRRLRWPALVAGGIAPLVWPHLRPVPAWPGLEGWLAGLTDGGAGLVVGLLLGRLAATIWQARDRLGLIVTFGAVGLFLGWQAVVAIAVASTAIRFPVRVVVRLCPSWNRLPPTMWLALTTLVWLFAWKPLFAHWPLMK